MVEKLKDAATSLQSLAEPCADTASPAGRMVLIVFAVILKFKRALVRQRSSGRRIAAKARGVRFGGPLRLTDDQIALVKRLVGKGLSMRAAAKLLK